MSDQQKQFYLYIDGQTVPVSEEVYREYRHYARKEEYFLHDLKREKFVCDQAARTATFTLPPKVPRWRRRWCRPSGCRI